MGHKSKHRLEKSKMVVDDFHVRLFGGFCETCFFFFESESGSEMIAGHLHVHVVRNSILLFCIPVMMRL